MSSPQFERLFSPIVIGGVKIRNRVAIPPMNVNYSGVNGEVTKTLIDYHVARAKGGVGLHIIEASRIVPEAVSYTHLTLPTILLV